MKRKIVLFMLSVLSCVALCFPAGAAFKDWASIDADQPVAQDGDNVVITNKGYYPGPNGGVMLQEAVDLKEGASLTFTIDAMPSLSSDGADFWVSIGVFDQPNYMDVSNPDQAAGLVILIRPDTDVATANVQSLLKGQPFAQSSTNIPLYDFKEGGSYTFEIKKEDDKYVVLWNGKAMKTEFGAELDLSWLNGAFQDDKAYLALSMSDNQSKESKATITALNGQAPVGGKDIESPDANQGPGEDASHAPADSSSGETGSKAGDSEENAPFHPAPFIIIGIVAVVVIAAIAAVVVRKRGKKE